MVVVLGGPWAAGRALRSRRLLIDDLRATTKQLELSQQELAERAVEAERLRIAREVHDIVAHSVTVMTVQADAADRTLNRDPAQARAAINAVQDTGRQAQAQLRQMLGVLRPGSEPITAGTDAAGDDPGVVLTPQPQVAQLEPLVDRFRATGLHVDYQPLSAPVDLPQNVGLTVYRVVQEGLTNVLRHSAAGQASVAVSHRGDHVLATVRDPGPTKPPRPSTNKRAWAGRHERTGARLRRRPHRSRIGGRRIRGQGPPSAAARLVTGSQSRPGQHAIRLVIVDDQTLVRRGFALILGEEPDMVVVGEAADGKQALAVCRDVEPDVVLMDVRMPVMNGLDATRALVSAGSSRVLMLTTFDLDAYVYEAIRAGASGFLLKDVRPDVLAHSVRAVARGDTMLAPAITRRLVEEFVSRPAPGTIHSGLASLTGREREVLTQMARGRSNAEIAAQLYLSETTVKTHVTRILAKLSLRDRVQAVVLAYETGLLRPGARPTLAPPPHGPPA